MEIQRSPRPWLLLRRRDPGSRAGWPWQPATARRPAAARPGGKREGRRLRRSRRPRTRRRHRRVRMTGRGGSRRARRRRAATTAADAGRPRPPSRGSCARRARRSGRGSPSSLLIVATTGGKVRPLWQRSATTMGGRAVSSWATICSRAGLRRRAAITGHLVTSGAATTLRGGLHSSVAERRLHGGHLLLSGGGGRMPARHQSNRRQIQKNLTIQVRGCTIVPWLCYALALPQRSVIAVLPAYLPECGS